MGGSSGEVTFAVAEPGLGIASWRLIAVADESKVWWLLKGTRKRFFGGPMSRPAPATHNPITIDLMGMKRGLRVFASAPSGCLTLL